MYPKADDVRLIVREDAKLFVTTVELEDMYAGVCITVLADVLEVT